MGNVKVTLKTRKPVHDHELTPADFRTFPIWTFATGEEDKPGRDETWVRPLRLKRVTFNLDTLLVAAEFETPRGQLYSGFMTVIWGDLAGGALVGAFGYLSLPDQSPTDARRLKDFISERHRTEALKTLELKEEELFPLRYRLRVLFKGERTFRAGRIS